MSCCKFTVNIGFLAAHEDRNTVKLQSRFSPIRLWPRWTTFVPNGSFDRPVTEPTLCQSVWLGGQPLFRQSQSTAGRVGSIHDFWWIGNGQLCCNYSTKTQQPHVIVPMTGAACSNRHCKFEELLISNRKDYLSPWEQKWIISVFVVFDFLYHSY